MSAFYGAGFFVNIALGIGMVWALRQELER